MNIMHVVFSFNNGGIENLLVDILNSWNVPDDEIYICVINNNFDEELLNKISNNKIKKVLLMRPVGGKKLQYIRNLTKIIKENNIDIIHAHSNSVLKFCLFAKIKYGVKLVYSVHDTMIYNKLNKLDILIHKLFIEKIICISNVVYEGVKYRTGHSDKIMVIYNGVDHTKFITRKTQYKEKFRIGCVARIDPKVKGQDVLIKAISLLKEKRKDFECVIVGAPPLENKKHLTELLELCECLQVEDYVKFIGNSNEVPQLLSTFDLAIIPSYKEGFGISIIEAIFSKVPVIASDIEGPKEIIKENLYGTLFEVGNYNDLYIKINDLLNNEDIRKIENSYIYALNKFSISNMIKSLREVYCNCSR